MAAFNTSIYKDTFDLITFYNNNLTFRNSFKRWLANGNVTYKGRRLKAYVRFIAYIDSQYNEYLNKSLDEPTIHELFEHVFLRNHELYQQLGSSIETKTALLPEAVEQEIEEIEKLPEGEEKKKRWEDFAEKAEVPTKGFLKLDAQAKQIQERKRVKDEAAAKQTTAPTKRFWLLPVKKPKKPAEIEQDEEPSAPQLSNQEIEQLVEEETNPQIVEEPTALESEPSEAVGPTAPEPPASPEPVQEPSSGGQTSRMAQDLEDRAARGLTNAARRGGSSLARGAGSLASRAGNLAVQGAARLGVAAIAGASGVAGAIGGTIVVAIIIILVILVLTPLMKSQLETSALLGGSALGSSTTRPVFPVGEINSCEFTRSDHNPKARSYQSNLLLQYFQEASGLTQIPPVVIAAFMRVESPALTSFTDEQVRNYQCAVSKTGALGVMQIQPKGTKGHDAPAVANGARLINVNYEDLTEDEYCDVRKSIIMGAGFILKKMSYYGFGDGSKWDQSWTDNEAAIEALVTGYYGCLLYGGPRDCTGPYNYATDVLTSIRSCRVGGAPVTPGELGISLTCPLDPVNNTLFAIECGTRDNPVNSCGHGGDGYAKICVPSMYECVGKNYSDALYHSIDVKSAGPTLAGTPVYLPFADGNKVINWRFQSSVLSGSASCNWGYKQVYTASFNGRNLILYITHVQERTPLTDPDGSGNIPSGSQIGTLTNGHGSKILPNGNREPCTISPHLHTSISVDGRWVEPEKEAYMCARR